MCSIFQHTISDKCGLYQTKLIVQHSGLDKHCLWKETYGLSPTQKFNVQFIVYTFHTILNHTK